VGPGGLTPLLLAVEADQPRTLGVLIDAGKRPWRARAAL